MENDHDRFQATITPFRHRPLSIISPSCLSVRPKAGEDGTATDEPCGFIPQPPYPPFELINAIPTSHGSTSTLLPRMVRALTIQTHCRQGTQRLDSTMCGVAGLTLDEEPNMTVGSIEYGSQGL